MYGDHLFRYALVRVNDRGIAEDLVQEALLGGIRSLASFDGRSTIKTWLIAILNNKIRDHFKRLGRNQTVFLATNLGEDETELGSLLKPEIKNSQFESAIELDEFQASLEQCMSELPAHFQAAFRLRLMNAEASVDKLSEQLEISAGNFNVRLFRARLMIRKCLERVWLGNK